MQLSQPDGKPPESSDIVLPGGGNNYREVSVQATMNYAPKYDRFGSPTYIKSTVEFVNVTITPSGFMSLPLIIKNDAISVNLEVRHKSVIIHQSINSSINSLMTRINRMIRFESFIHQLDHPNTHLIGQ